MLTSREMAALNEQEAIAVEINRGANELAYLSADYLLYREDSQLERWRTLWQSVSDDVARLTPSTPQQRAIKVRIQADLQRVKNVFEEVASSPNGAARPDQGFIADERFQVSWSRMAVQNQSATYQSLRLLRVLRDQEQSASRDNALLVSAMLILFAIFFAANYLIVVRRALNAISQLRAGTRVVGSGDLDYAIPVSRSDEIGELTRAFNRMTQDLKGVTASKMQLEFEVAEREKAQVALRNSLERIAVLSDARERELETTKLLLDAARALAEWTDINHVLEVLADIVLASTEHTRVTVSTWDEIRRELRDVVVLGGSKYPVQPAFTWDDISEPGQSVITSLRPRVVDYDALPDEGKGRVARIGARLGLLVPIVYRGRLMGLVRVDDPGDRRQFLDPEVALIQGIAAQAAVAIENARLYQEQCRVADALRSIFQAPVPVIPGVVVSVVGHYASAAEKVGGDFYDMFELEDEVGVLMGDVAGKGLAAVGLTERVRSTVRALAYAEETLAPDYLLRRVNESLVRQVSPGEFVTAVLLALNPKTGAYRLARAGHTHPVVCGDSCRQIEIPSGPPLGVFLGEYEVVSGVLESDETIVLY
ncbi:HAMP domain-containing protein, partial [bacterium]|nr:HAMP domain-containing protein [bacterium]